MPTSPSPRRQPPTPNRRPLRGTPAGPCGRRPGPGCGAKCAPTRVKAHAIDQRVRFRRHPNIHSHRPEEKPNVNSPGNKQQGHVQRFQDAVSTGDAEVISKTIDELVEPDVLIHMPLPIEATGA